MDAGAGNVGCSLGQQSRGGRDWRNSSADKMGRPNRLQADSEEAVVTVMQDAASEGWRREGSRYLHRWVRYWKGGKAVDGVVFAWKDTHESNFSALKLVCVTVLVVACQLEKVERVSVLLCAGYPAKLFRVLVLASSNDCKEDSRRCLVSVFDVGECDILQGLCRYPETWRPSNLPDLPLPWQPAQDTDTMLIRLSPTGLDPTTSGQVQACADCSECRVCSDCW